MTEIHPDRYRLEQFMRGDLPGESSKDIVKHLLSGCEPCRRIARESFPCAKYGVGSSEPMPEQWQSTSANRYAQVLDRVLPEVWKSEETLANERDLTPHLVAELEGHPHERRLLLIRNSRRFRSWSLCGQILDKAYGLGFKDPKAAVDFGKLGVEISESLDNQTIPAGLLMDLRARAHSILGNALRISGDLHESARHFEVASEHLKNGTGDQLEAARHEELKSHLFFEHRDFETSISLLASAIRVYRAHGESHRLGRALVSRGFQLSEKGDLTTAIASLRQGLRFVDSTREPRLALVAKHNLVHHLYDTGRYHQAMAMVPETRELHRQHGNEMDEVRFQWLIGQILRDSGELASAEGELLEVKDFFVQRQIAHDSALVSLDLAAIYLRQNRTAELKQIAGQMLSIFRALRINREAIAALVLFQKAVEVERVTLGLMRDLAAYLKNSRHDPRLPFRPSITN